MASAKSKVAPSAFDALSQVQPAKRGAKAKTEEKPIIVGHEETVDGWLTAKQREETAKAEADSLAIPLREATLTHWHARMRDGDASVQTWTLKGRVWSPYATVKEVMRKLDTASESIVRACGLLGTVLETRKVVADPGRLLDMIEKAAAKGQSAKDVLDAAGVSGVIEEVIVPMSDMFSRLTSKCRDLKSQDADKLLSAFESWIHAPALSAKGYKAK